MNRRTEGWLWAGLLFGPIPTAVFALGVAVLAFIAKCIVYTVAACIVAVGWMRTTYFRWRTR